MAQPFIGQIMMFGFNFAPVNYAFCQGQLMAISQNEALFAILGTTFGGDGVQTFALPNMQGRSPLNVGNGPGLSNYVLGEQTGTEAITLTTNQMPSHVHTATGTTSAATQSSPAGQTFAKQPDGYLLYGAGAPTPMAAGICNLAGGSLPHENRQPLLVINFCIALFGIFPSRN